MKKEIMCDICKHPAEEYYVDGKTVFGPWANMCIACHKIHGVGLGINKGQKYNVKTRNKVDG